MKGKQELPQATPVPPACPSANGVCGHHGAAATVTLAEALSRFEREAVRDVCDTGRYRCPYYVWGQGPPLVFLHGMADNSRSFLLATALLSRHFRCVAYDLPTGRGDRARVGRYTHADLVADLWALLDHLRLRQSYVFASSFGSTVALAALRERPERLPRAVLQGGLARRPLARAEWLVAQFARHWPGRMGRLPIHKRFLREVHYGPFAGRPPEVWDYFTEGTGRTSVRAFAHQALMLHRLDLRPLLAEVRQPVLLVCGDEDRVVGREHEEVLLRGLPNAGRVELLGCGHVPALTHPEVLAEVVRQFLTPPCRPTSV